MTYWGKSVLHLLVGHCNSLIINPIISSAAHLTDQLSNFRIIPDYLKVVDFIEEIGYLSGLPYG